MLSLFIYRFCAWIIRFIFRINGGLEIKGRDNIPMEGGAVVASNHISYLDPPLIGAIVPRQATFMARRGLFDIKIPIMRWFIHRYAFPVDREKIFPSTIKEAVRRLKGGELLVIFPEGRRSDTGELLEGKKGVGMIASLSNAPVVPTLVIGTDKALPVGGRWLRRAKVRVIFDKPMDFSTINASGLQNASHNKHEIVTKRIMTVIGELKKNYADNNG